MVKKVKLSELCKMHLKRSWHNDSDYNDTVTIQLNNILNDFILVYFDTDKTTHEEYTIRVILWVDKNSGKVIMFEGRLAMEFYGKNKENNTYWSLVKQETVIDLDFENCKDLDNVYFD